MVCLKCGFENPPGMKFCGQCGTGLERNCPRCNVPNPPQFRFCGECGYEPADATETTRLDYSQPQSYTPKFLADKILTARTAIEGERKIVTVLFADVAKSTSIFEKLDPENVHQIMDGCFRILMNEVHKLEGTVNEFRGDGIMALFGAPIAHEDHAQRACHAALDIQTAVKEYARTLQNQYGIDFKMRVGLNTGPVVVGAIGDDLRMDYTAKGDTCNLASRMESNADPGTVLVSGNTYKLTRHSFQFESLGKIQVKGKSELQEVFRLRGRIDTRLVAFDRQVASPMVGREGELNLLAAQVEQAAQGKGAVVNVIGEAGIGKSRLIAELKQLPAARRARVIEGRAISTGRNLSFHPIIDLLKRWAGICEEDTGSAALDKLESIVRAASPDHVDEVVPFVGTLMGMQLPAIHAERLRGIEGEALEKLMLKNVREILIGASRTAPLVIVIEDLHWADASSIQLLESLYRLVEHHGILFVNVFRPGYFHLGKDNELPIGRKLREHYVEIVMQPLSKDMVEALIGNMLDTTEFHFALRDQIVQRTGGNPFFVEEVVRSLIDEGAIVFKKGRFQVTDKIDSVTIPSTVNDVLMARIDRLEERTKELVKVASVIGRSFFERIIKDVASFIADIDARLAYLKELQLIRDRIRMDELEYLFKHALAQEAAYQSTLMQRRKFLHLKVARVIESLFRNRLHEFYGMLAYHYSRGEDLHKAEEYMTKAGEEALRSSASTEALAYYEEGLKLYVENCGHAADPERIAAFEKNMALALFNKGQWIRSVQHFDAVLKRWGAGSPENKSLVALRLVRDLFIVLKDLYFPTKEAKRAPSKRESEIIDIRYKLGQALVSFDNRRLFFEAMGLLRSAARLDITKVPNGAELWVSATGFFSYTGLSFTIGNKFLERAKQVLNKDNVREMIAFFAMDTMHNCIVGTWGKIGDLRDTLVERAIRKGEFWHASLYLSYLALEKAEAGEFDEVKRLIERLQEMREVYEFDLAALYIHRLKADMFIKSRQPPDAENEADEGIAHTAEKKLEPSRLHFIGFKAIARILRGDLDGARESLAYADELIARKRSPAPQNVAPYLRARALLDTHMLKHAIELGHRSDIPKWRKAAHHSFVAALRNSAKYAPGRTDLLRSMGEYYRLMGMQRNALEWWNKAIQEGERLGARVDLSRAYFEVGRALQESQSQYKMLQGIEAKGYLEKAEVLFREIGLEKDLEDLRNLRRAL